MRKPLRSTFLAVTLAIAASGAAFLPQTGYAGANVGVVIHVPPPALRHELPPPPRRGYLWVPGYWDWRGRHHIWVAGAWVRERRGYHYRPHAWVERNGGWYMDRGRWDRDGDGIPDRYDRHPNNPYRP